MASQKVLVLNLISNNVFILIRSRTKFYIYTENLSVKVITFFPPIWIGLYFRYQNIRKYMHPGTGDHDG